MSSVFNPAIPAGAYDAFLPDALVRARAQREWTPADGPLPALYLSHGAPPLFDDGPWLRELLDWAQRLPRPKSILIVSAHWEDAPLAISASAAHTPLVYDFGGFHPRYYRMKYDTPDATALAHRVAAAMPDGEPLYQHTNRGLDHGAWVPLMAMYPLADIPVLQLSLPTHDPVRLMELGRRLAGLREEGVLVIGSGFMTHGLPFVTREMLDGVVPAWSSDFDQWAAEALAKGDVDELAAYASRAPGMPYAHPTPDHFLPLFIALGSADDPERAVRTTIDGFMMGFAKRSFEVA
ncbi:dioxygenase [Streptomyces acidiscabies]|uniref:Class III extradiol ring-cleavage dioxygenase n=1 Tax=Streptomyces acidiscabies TaxID=42234 RepID=A0AAP6BHI3_9ACTN|nr:class III extradiol ring-cleavage dioxygenase [Streptomyces acidiscabies]MBP5934891.1 dioxygenase [Streptomyces sp. LBUM 1476]MBZ3917346.1 dioxygenase [Streptomyces acidiscabies]MDX2964871.1 class III extradiol ring-cleavage dioxygenase [Streptomyces acidiscabies]MDX3023372.1 class III extradiol ring-cleavage dioxygenase [Streptomyces acidiscabies]MDX3796520.1 class III extradiol ring-cleavage dioxygenase [Streptomyces acidiscabies]